MQIGIDIGATKARIGEIEEGKVIRAFEEKTEKGDIANQIIKLINRFDLLKADGIGIGIAGQIKNGVVISSPNIGIKNLNLYKILKENFNLPFIIENDSNCQTMGEYIYGAGKGRKNIIGIFIGTGIGGGIIIDGKLIKGSEIGHIVIDINGAKCGCGRMGCFEALASGIALKRYTKEAGFKDGSASFIAKEAKSGEKKAQDIIRRLGVLIGIGTTNLINILNPEAVILGGGVIEGLPELVDIVRQFVKKEALFPCIIKKAELGNDSGIIGSGFLAKNCLNLPINLNCKKFGFLL
ncbi:MAG: ROK family protein [bacterium]